MSWRVLMVIKLTLITFIQTFIHAIIIPQKATIRNKFFITKSALILVKWNVDFNVIVICITALQGMKNCEINWLRLHNSLLMIQQQCNTMFIMIIRCILSKKHVHNQWSKVVTMCHECSPLPFYLPYRATCDNVNFVAKFSLNLLELYFDWSVFFFFLSSIILSNSS